MASKAIVLITCVLGHEKEIAKQLKNIPNVADAHLVYGIYDIVAIVDGDTPEKLKETITYKIPALDKVRTTVGIVVVE